MDKMDDDYEDDDDEDDEDEEVFQVDKQMIDEGKKAVVKVFRTIKFISTNKQEADFFDAVMDNYGKEELIYLPNADDAHQQRTARYRRIFKATYKKYWLKYFNQYRNYTQVSNQWSLMLTSPQNSDLQPIILMFTWEATGQGRSYAVHGGQRLGQSTTS